MSASCYILSPSWFSVWVMFHDHSPWVQIYLPPVVQLYARSSICGILNGLHVGRCFHGNLKVYCVWPIPAQIIHTRNLGRERSGMERKREEERKNLKGVQSIVSNQWVLKANHCCVHLLWSAVMWEYLVDVSGISSLLLKNLLCRELVFRGQWSRVSLICRKEQNTVR